MDTESDLKQEMYYSPMPDLPVAIYKSTEEKEVENSNFATSYSV